MFLLRNPSCLLNSSIVSHGQYSTSSILQLSIPNSSHKSKHLRLKYWGYVALCLANLTFSYSPNIAFWIRDATSVFCTSPPPFYSYCHPYELILALHLSAIFSIYSEEQLQYPPMIAIVFCMSEASTRCAVKLLLLEPFFLPVSNLPTHLPQLPFQSRHPPLNVYIFVSVDFSSLSFVLLPVSINFILQSFCSTSSSLFHYQNQRTSSLRTNPTHYWPNRVYPILVWY